MRTMALRSRFIAALAGAASLAAAVSSFGCAEAPPRPNLEDKARRVAPIPACIMYLPPRKDPNAKAFIRQLREDQYWKLIYPAFNPDKLELPNGAADCTGKPILSHWKLQGADPLRGWPEKTEEGDIVYGAGGDRLKIVWLRSHRFPNGDYGGALAIVRTMENFAEAYGVGVLVGNPKRMKLALERMGPEVILTAADDQCTGAPLGTPCETHVQVFLPRRGMLVELADIPLERKAYAFNSEPGAKGRFEYKLTSAPEYKPGTVKIFEKIEVRDERGIVVRKAELERLFVLLEEGELKANEGPLWPRVFSNKKAPATKK
jgi:hypothetical protein